MKFSKYIAALLLVTLGFSSCEDFLEPAPTAGITTSNYFGNAEEVESGIIAIYDAIQGINSTSSNVNHGVMQEYYVTEMRSDNTRTKTGEGEAAQFELFAAEATNGLIADYYASYYEVIARANTVLDNLGVITDPETTLSFEGEAKFLRAYAYFNLVRLFGDVPLIDRVISPLDVEAQYTRVSTDQVYNLIVSDLLAAVAGLDNTYKTRASKAAAQTLLAKVYLTLGQNYVDAQILLEDVMGSGFMLMPNFNDVFYSERNAEVIFAIGYEQGLQQDSQNFSAEMLNAVGRTVGVNYVTQDAVMVLDMHGGDRTQYSYRQDRIQTTQNQVIKYLPNGEDGGANGITFNADPRLAGNDWIVLRYADVLLMHAEAIMAGASETSNMNALSSFNRVRNRAGLDDDADDTLTKEELLLERRVELAFENHRFFDLIRFGQAETVLSAFAAEYGGTFTASDLLLPIPQREINLSKGLMNQNPGY